MSIGFCTDVAETKLTSKAFTIVYIFLGASVVGGSLALFIQDIVEGVVDRKMKHLDEIMDYSFSCSSNNNTNGCNGGIDNNCGNDVQRPFRNRSPTMAQILRTKFCRFQASTAYLIQSVLNETNRIYFVFIAWIMLGVTWGVLDMGWDAITATHFAVSALATGGLTAPPVDENGYEKKHAEWFFLFLLLRV